MRYKTDGSYVNAAVAAFYLEVSGQGYRLERYAYATAV